MLLLSLGATLILDEGEFNATRWYQILSHFKVINWYTSPTALRMMIKVGEELTKKFDFSSILRASSVGEALEDEVIRWIKNKW